VKKTSIKRAAMRASLLLLTLSCSVYSYSSVIDRPFLRATSIVIVLGASDFKENGGQALVATDFLLLDNVAPGQIAPDIIAGDGTTIYGLDYDNTFAGLVPLTDGTEITSELLRIRNQTSGGTFTSTGRQFVLDPTDSFTAFGINGATRIEVVRTKTNGFFIASNVPFDIYAQASNLTTTKDFTSMGFANIEYQLFSFSVANGSNTWSSQAQNPAVGGSGINNAVNDLNDMAAAPVKVFDGGRKTAAGPGTIMEQMYAFNPRYYFTDGAGNDYDFSYGIGSIGADVTYTVYTP
jgi:hypothetical protein